MFIPSVKTIRRILVGVIGVVALAVVLNYLSVALRRPHDDGKKPSMISSEFRHAAEGVEIFVRKDSDLRFTIRARRLRETIQDRSFLEEIESSDFNPDGSVRNSIYSDSAVYDPRRKTLDFDGDVRVFLGDDVELRAESLHYNLDTEIGVIPGMMEFLSNSVYGRARDIRFYRDEDRLEMNEEVDFSLARKNTTTEEGAIRATAMRGTCLLAENRILFSGGVRIESPDMGRLSADSVDIGLDQVRSRITYMTASGKTGYEMKSNNETLSISGGRMFFTAGATGALEKALISEHANLQVKSANEERAMRAGEIEIFLNSTTGAVNEIRGTESADFRYLRGADETLADGDVIHAEFAATDNRLRDVRLSGRSRLSLTGKGSATSELRADTIEAKFFVENGDIENLTANESVRLVFDPPDADIIRTLHATKLEISYDGNYPDSGEASGAVRIEESGAVMRMTRRLEAERIRFDFFSGSGHIKNLMADNGVHIVYERAASPFSNSDIERYQTFSDSLDAVFTVNNGTGVVLRATQHGNFRIISDGRSASADQGEYDADNGKLTLTGSSEILDDAGSLKGDRIGYDLNIGELLTKGSVRAVLYARQGKDAFFHAGFNTGGGASPVVITAEELRYLPDKERFKFSGGVEALTENQQINAQDITIADGGNMTAEGNILHRIQETDVAATIESAQMEYVHDEGVIRYSGKVEMKSDGMTFSADTLKATLEEEGNGIRRILAERNVFVRHAGRVCNGDTVEWIPASSSYVITGDPATIDDPAHGRSMARRITYFQDDDRITLEPLPSK